jgi:hypothetical protein
MKESLKWFAGIWVLGGVGDLVGYCMEFAWGCITGFVRETFAFWQHTTFVLLEQIKSETLLLLLIFESFCEVVWL